MSLNIIILAAGLGKRMQTHLPKVLHPLGGKPLLQHVVETATKINPENIFVVYGHGGALVREQCKHLRVQWVEQSQRLGTGHATAQVLPFLQSSSGQVLVLVGDIPLISALTLEKLLAKTSDNKVGLVTAKMPDPTGLGRVLRNADGHIVGIVEEKDASPEQRQIDEINTGIIGAPLAHLQRWLPQLRNNNQQNEYYLPDIIAMAVAEMIEVQAVLVESHYEICGINDRAQLATMERYYQRQRAHQLMLNGVTLLDPDRFDLRGDLQTDQDVTIDINVIVEGKVKVGSNSFIGPNTILRNVTIGRNVVIKSNCVIEDTEIADNCIIGPFARIRPETHLAEGVHIGNFVELKNAKVGQNSKINHLSYVGDANVGQDVNIGAGTITCNYDGVNKYQTIIKDRAFIGSDTQIIAPLTIGEGATIAAGSTITHDVAAETLTLTHRLEQRTVAGWKRGKKK